jgi:radical SAM protein with 4Fe4S-binding SPASM domain
MKKIFNSFLERGKAPFDYENVFLTQYKPRIEKVFKGEAPLPFEIEIQPSPYCNAECDHCWAQDFSKLENKLEDKKNIDRVVQQITSLNSNGVSKPKVKFCGATGNPSMNKNLGYFINQFYGKNKIRLFDNGIKIGQNVNNDKYLEDFSKLNLLYLSLDAGTTETLHNIKPGAKKANVSVENILEGCQKLRAMNPELGVNVSYVITNKNYKEVPEAARKSKEYGMNLIRYRIDLTEEKISDERTQKIVELLREAVKYEDSSFRVVPIHNDKQIENKNDTNFGSKGKDFKCMTSNFWTCIGSNGDLYPCGHSVDRETDTFGNILKEDFPDIWNSEKRKQVQENLPGEKCTICSPFSLSVNEFGTFLLGLPENQREELLYEYYSKK